MAEYNPSKIIKDGNTYNFRDTTKIPLAGSNQISGDLIPSTDNAIDIGSSTKNIKMLYTKGITINGTQFLPSDYATLSSLSTVATSGSYNDLSNKPTIPTVNDATLTIQQNGTTVDTFTANSSSDKTVNIQCVDLTNNQTVGGDKEFTGTTTAHDVIPSATNTYNLGTSAKKWKSLNGLNPGALSLPSNSYINIDTTNWDLTCSNRLLGSFTPAADGWLMLQISNSGSNEVNFWLIGGVIRINNKSTINTSANSNFNLITIPVIKDTQYNIYGMPSEYVAERKIAFCRFAPCQGNV